jgi:hypothetical protein
VWWQVKTKLDTKTLRWCARKLRNVERQANKHRSDYACGMAVCARLIATDYTERARAIEAAAKKRKATR